MSRFAPGVGRLLAISVLLAVTSLGVMTAALLDRPNLWTYTAVNGVVLVAVAAIFFRVLHLQRRVPSAK